MFTHTRNSVRFNSIATPVLSITIEYGFKQKLNDSLLISKLPTLLIKRQTFGTSVYMCIGLEMKWIPICTALDFCLGRFWSCARQWYSRQQRISFQAKLNNFCGKQLSHNCVVPENIYTHPKEGWWKFQREVGFPKHNFLEEGMTLKWNFQRVGGRGLSYKTFCERCMDVFWNNTFGNVISMMNLEMVLKLKMKIVI